MHHCAWYTFCPEAINEKDFNRIHIYHNKTRLHGMILWPNRQPQIDCPQDQTFMVPGGMKLLNIQLFPEAIQGLSRQKLTMG